MFSGKSEELIRRARRAIIARQNVIIFKPGIDHRYGINSVTSHDGKSIEAIAIDNAGQILEQINGETTVVIVDEAQFLDEGLVDVCRTLAAQGIRVITGGLDMDFKGEPFGPMPLLLSIADEIDKLHAICVVCGENALMTQRLVNGVPANYDDAVILIGADEAYEPRCRECHTVPGHPS
jgi:thymidine kinase